MSQTSRSTADSVSSAALPSPKERRRLREALALSEDQVAEAMGVTRATVRSWETGRTDPRGRKREAYAKLLGACEDESTPPRADPAPLAEAPRPAPEPLARTKTVATTRPKTAVKRAAKPPKTPGPTAAAPVPGRKAAQKPLERLKPAGEVRSVLAAHEAEPAPSAAVTRTMTEPAPEDAADYAPDMGAERPAEPAAQRSSLTPEEAFDALYAYAAPALVHQTYLLTGRRRLSRESVERAFHHAWQHWPEIAVDRDPVGWVRAAAYEYALSPWHRLRRAHRHPDALPTEAGRRALLTALLELPPPYRRTVLLYDGLGLDLPDTAAETEASTPATAHRLMHARTVIGQRVTQLADPDALHRRLVALVTEAPTATLPAARSVRTKSERRARLWTRAALGTTAALIGLTAFTAATAPTQYLPVHAPGETVNGVPVRGGSPKLTPEDKELREMLRARPHPGPERLVPAPH
ncbi:sigma factor-like helix-turn-helix DNA-binding protein [Streptomyces sp. NPDC006551]|uniref:helix-turn-helix domain-containing protein n=1 Tax=Streptomyces sp. NPDC006551 TaxID=3157178 RepID=UPI0033ACCD99